MSIGKTALSPAGQEHLVRWPSEDYIFQSQLRGVDQSNDGHEQSKANFIALYPELSHWDGRSLSSGWNDFSQWATWGDYPEPSERDEYFLAYLYLHQETGCGYPNHGGLDEFDIEWRALGK